MKKIKCIHFFNLLALVLLVSCGGSKTESTPAPKPTVDFSFSPLNPTTNDEISFVSTSTNAKTFLWTSVPAGISATAPTFKTKLTAAGSYQITVTAKGDGGEATVTKNIVVNAPVVNPLADFSFAPSSPVAGETVNFMATAQNATGFEWSSSPVGLVSTQQNPSFAFANAGNYQITLKVTGAAGSTPITVTKNLVVNAAKPIADFSFAPTNATAGQTITFTANTQNATTFAWSSVPAGLSSTLQNPTFAFPNAGSYQITLTATGAGGSTVVTKSLVVAASSLTAAFRVEPAQPKVGDNVTFSYTGTGATSYAWASNPAGLNATTQNATFKFANTGSYAITLTVKDAFGNTQTNTQNISVAASTGGTGSGCQEENKCNLPKCYLTRLVTTTLGGTITTTLEYITVAGIKVPSKLVVVTVASGITITNTSLYEYDSQARNTKISTTVQNPFSSTLVINENIFDGCRKTRTNNIENGAITSYSTYEYDGSGRLVKTNSFSAANQKTGQNVYSNFTAEGQPQNEEQSNASGTVTARVTTTYQNCQPSKVIGRDGAGAVITDLTGEFNANRFLSKTTVLSNAGGIAITSVGVYEYQCE